jgi:hypothetical protein
MAQIPQTLDYQPDNQAFFHLKKGKNTEGVN